MKKISICLKIILSTIVLLLTTANHTLAEPTVLEILTGRAEQTQSAASLVQRGRTKIEKGNFREAYRGIAQSKLESSLSFREAYVQAL